MVHKKKTKELAAQRDKNRKERIRSNPILHEQYKAKERARWQARRASGRIKTVDKLTAKEQAYVRKKWKIAQRKSYKLKKERKQHEQEANIITNYTPPASPTVNNQQTPPRTGNLPGMASGSNLCYKKAGRRKVKKSRAAAYRKIEKLEEKLKEEKKKSEKYRKRWMREQYKLKGTANTENKSPRKITAEMLGENAKKIPTQVKKAILLYNVVSSEIKDKLREKAGKRKEKQLLHKVMNGHFIRKYRLGHIANKAFGLSRLKRKNPRNCLKMNVISTQLKDRVRAFYERDDNSRITSGKKETITRFKLKKQKRLLLDSSKNLCMKFLAEEPEEKISYSAFARLRPFWVITPKCKDRETCLCEIHENISLKANKLTHVATLQKEFNVDEYVKRIVCPFPTKECYFRNCKKCKGKSVIGGDISTQQGSWNVSYWQWTKEEQVNKETGKKYKKEKKKEMSCTVSDLIRSFNLDVERKLSPHVFKIKHQFQAMKNLKLNLRKTEAILHMDFAENYACKCEREVQSFHFGASRSQVTLHNVMVYVGSGEGIKVKECISTISDCISHGAKSVWAYLDPVLTSLKKNHSEVTTIHLFTDGPSSQYRNKTFFYLFSTILVDYGFLAATHNIFEAGHGKGAPDGIGGTLKRMADKFVSNGNDILSAEEFHAKLRNLTTVKLFYVSSSDVERMDKKIDHIKLSVVPGTMSFHQIRTKEKGIITCRNLSCFCSSHCDCHQPIKTFHFPIFADTKIADNRIERREINLVDKTVIGAWCTVFYRFESIKKLYLGQISDAEGTEVKINTMHPVGENKFVWPSNKDEIWYPFEDVTCIMWNTDPEILSRRCVRVPQEFWRKASEKLSEMTQIKTSN